MHCAVVILRGVTMVTQGDVDRMMAVTPQEPKKWHIRYYTSVSTHPDVSLLAWVAICYSYGGCGSLVTNGYRCLVYQINESNFIAGRKWLTLLVIMQMF